MNIVKIILFAIPGEQEHHQPPGGVHQQGAGRRDQCVQVPGDWAETRDNLPQSEPRYLRSNVLIRCQFVTLK